MDVEGEDVGSPDTTLNSRLRVTNAHCVSQKFNLAGVLFNFDDEMVQ
jgi:hypothetical protein